MSTQDSATAMSSELKDELRDMKLAIRSLKYQRKELEENIDHLDKEDAEEQMDSLREQLAPLELHADKTLKENRERAKEVFGLLMRAGFRRDKDEDSQVSAMQR